MKQRLYLMDKKLQKKHGLLAGVDEAGVGPLAGPVIAAAVVFDFRKKVIFRKCPVCVRALREENNSGLCSICGNREKNKNMWYQFNK